jgi:hypothetical protein
MWLIDVRRGSMRCKGAGVQATMQFYEGLCSLGHVEEEIARVGRSGSGEREVERRRAGDSSPDVLFEKGQKSVVGKWEDERDVCREHRGERIEEASHCFDLFAGS